MPEFMGFECLFCLRRNVEKNLVSKTRDSNINNMNMKVSINNVVMSVMKIRLIGKSGDTHVETKNVLHHKLSWFTTRLTWVGGRYIYGQKWAHSPYIIP